MKVYRIIIIVLSVLVGISVSVFFALGSKAVINTFTDPITEEDYQILKDYALEIAKNPNTELDKDIYVTTEMNAESLIVDVNTSLYGVQATFPISNLNWKIKNGYMESTGIIDYNNVIYVEHPVVYSKGYFITLYGIGAFIFAVLTYFLFYFLPSAIIKKLTKKRTL